MAYIGNAPPSFFTSVAVDVFSGNASNTAFTLSKPITSTTDIEVVVDNIQQNPFSGSYSVNGTTLTFSSAPASGSNNVVVAYRQATIGSTVASANSVSSSSLQPNSVSNSALQSNLSFSGNVNFSSTGARITGDFSNATVANRVIFQSSTTNGSTVINLIPNGTGTTCAFGMDSDPALTNSSTGSLNLVASTDVRLSSGIRGTGTYLPMTFYTGGSERMRIDSSGVVGLNTASGTPRFEVGNITDSNNQGVRLYGSGDTTFQHLSATSDTLNFQQYYSSAWRTAAQIVGNSTADFKFNSGYGSAATAYGCRAWVNFNGTGVVAIRASGNVTSITDNGTGDYTVNFTTAMPDVNYSIVGSSGSGNAYGSYAFNNPGAGARFAVGSCRINSFITQSAGLADVDTVCVSIFR